MGHSGGQPNALTQRAAKQYMIANPLADPKYDYNEKKRKRVKRAIPEGLTPQEAKILSKVRHRAHRLDHGMSICGLKFGFAAMIGFLPVVGEFADLFLGCMCVIRKARQADLPWSITMEMIGNHAIAEGVGMIPVFGDIFLAWWKANSRNSWLLEKHLVERIMKREQERLGVPAGKGKGKAKFVTE